MWNQLSEIAPKALVAATVAWGGAHYLLIGPEVAARVVRADYLPMCQAQYHDSLIAEADRQIGQLRQPTRDAVKEMAAEQLSHLRNAPLMREFDRMGLSGLLGMDRTFNLAQAQYEQQKGAALDTYNRAVTEIKAATATKLGAKETYCGIVADAAIGATRVQWAVFTSTLGLIRPDPLSTFDKKMAEIQSTSRLSSETGR